MKLADNSKTAKIVGQASATPVGFHTHGKSLGRMMAVVFTCHMKWEELEPTDNDQVGHCASSAQSVFAVADENDFKQAVAAGQCVRVELDDRRDRFLGAPAYGYPEKSSLNWDE